MSSITCDPVQDQIHHRLAKALTAHHSKSFYFAATLLPRDCRNATWPVYAFCRYFDNLVDKNRQRSPEEIRSELAHYQNELQLAFRTGRSEHPIIGPFIRVAVRYDIPKKLPLELISGIEMDLHITRYETFEALYPFCYRVAAVVGLMMTHILGFNAPEALEHAEALGIAMQLTNILRDIAEDAANGRIYLPADDLERFGVPENDILQNRFSDRFRKLMQFQADRARVYYTKAETGIPMLTPGTRFAITAALQIYRRILNELEKQDFNPFIGRARVSRWTKVGLVLRERCRTRQT